jgi:hypothetical protein
MKEETQPSPPIYFVGILAWLVPGAGHWMLGMRGRGAAMFFGIVLTFLIGVALGSVFQVNPDRPETHSFWYVLQLICGLPTIAATFAQNALSQSAAVEIYGRGVDLGELYTRVAGLLNLMCILDALLHCSVPGYHRTLAAESKA